MFQQDELLFIKKQMDQRLAAHSGTVALPWHLFLLYKTLLTLSSLIHNWLSLLCHFHIPVQQRRELRLWRRRESGGHLHISFTSSVNRGLGMQPFFWAALVSLSNGLWVLRINSINHPIPDCFWSWRLSQHHGKHTGTPVSFPEVQLVTHSILTPLLPSVFPWDKMSILEESSLRCRMLKGRWTDRMLTGR